MFNGEGPARRSVFDAPVPQLVFLGILGGLSLVASAIFALWANSIDVGVEVFFDPSDANLKAALAAWADILLVVGVTASVGSIALDGVLHLLKRVVGASEATSSEDAR